MKARFRRALRMALVSALTLASAGLVPVLQQAFS